MTDVVATADAEVQPAETPSLLTKVARLLAALEADEGDMGLSEVTRASGVNKATTYRLCNELAELGFVERTGAGYRLGPRLFELGQRVPKARVYRETALPFMEDLFMTTGATVHLALPDATEVFYVEKIMGHNGVKHPSRVAGRMPMHCTASGKALIAFGPPGLLRDVVRRGLAPRTRYSIRSADHLAREVASVRDAGCAREHEESRLGYASLACPIFHRSKVATAALSVTSSLSNGDPERWAPSVRRAADGISHALKVAAV